MWTLVIYIYAGMLSKSDAVALTNVEGFTSEKACLVAGQKSKSLTENSYKETRFLCVKVKD